MNDEECSLWLKSLDDAKRLAELLLEDVKKYATYIDTVESRKCTAELWKHKNMVLLIPKKGPCKLWKIFRDKKRIMANYDVPVLTYFLYLITGDPKYRLLYLAYLRGYQDGTRDAY